MATWLMIHSPLLGPATWRRVAEELRQRGENTLVPDLGPALSAEGSHAVAQAELVAEVVTTGPVRLVGHSGAGPLLPVIAERLRSHGVSVTASVFVDAGLPHPGRSAMEILPPPALDHLRLMTVDGWLPPWTSWWAPEQLEAMLPDPDLRRLVVDASPRVPISLLAEALPSAGEGGLGTCSYVRLSASYEPTAQQAERAGWRVHRVEADHLALVTSPSEVADALQLVG